MRGDRPFFRLNNPSEGLFTPHARGSTSADIRFPLDSIVYPACAGIDRSCLLWSVPCLCLPRMRGDRPYLIVKVRRCEWFTPHARGSTPGKVEEEKPLSVYPACAGIDRPHFSYSPGLPRLPRMRGDRPGYSQFGHCPLEFTPHARGSTSSGHIFAL